MGGGVCDAGVLQVSQQAVAPAHKQTRLRCILRKRQRPNPDTQQHDKAHACAAAAAAAACITFEAGVDQRLHTLRVDALLLRIVPIPAPVARVSCSTSPLTHHMSHVTHHTLHVT